VRIIDEFVNRCKLKEFGFTHAKHAPEGRPPYHPGDLLKLYIYGYLNRIRSSRLLEKECKRNLELIPIKIGTSYGCLTNSLPIITPSPISEETTPKLSRWFFARWLSSARDWN
jgi:hypothetical protein